MNARASENDLAISRSSSASKSVEIFWASHSLADFHEILTFKNRIN
jgi:hypothetical protein